MAAGWAVVVAGILSTSGARAATLLVTSTADSGAGSLRAAITSATSGDTIQFQVGGTITLASELPIITKSITIDGNGNNPVISGAGTYRPFFIGDAGTTGSTYAVTLKNLGITNAVAQGGSGIDGGGGGAGLGGAIFVSSNGALTLSNVSVASSQARGGAGGGFTNNLAGGGGGMGGNGGNSTDSSGNGGGGLLVGTNSSSSPTGSKGGGSNGGTGSGYQTIDSAGGQGGFGGGGGGAYATSGVATGGAGGFGGGGGGASGGLGGAAGSGGYGGGGGSSFAAVNTPASGGNGGFGGGGGSGYNTGIVTAGTGGFGGGAGHANSFPGNGGGGGLGAGGAVYVQAGGTVSISGTVDVNGNGVTGGSAGGTGAVAGSAFGSGIFFQGTSGTTTTLGFGAGNQTIADVIADYTGSGGTNPGGGTNAADQGGSVAVSKSNGGTLTLSGPNTYSGGTTINEGTTLVVGNGGALGSGALTLNGGTTGVTVNFNGSFSVGNNIVATGDPTYNVQTGNTVTLTGVLSGTGDVVVNAGSGYAGTLVLAGANSYSGGTTLSGGTLTLDHKTTNRIDAAGTGGISLKGSAGILRTDLTGTLSNAITSNYGSTATIAAAAGQTLTLSGYLVFLQNLTIGSSSDTGIVVFANSGETVSYGSTLTVAGGTLTQTGIILGFTTNTSARTTVASGAAIDFANHDSTIRNLQGSGTVTAGTGRLTLDAGNFSGVISGSGGLAKDTSDSLVLTGANTYSGGTTIQGGTLQLSGAGTLGAVTATTTAAGGTLDLGATTQTQAAVNLAGGTIQNGYLNAPITSTGGALNGIGGTASLTTTAGTTIVSGVNTYSGGTTVNGGVLDVLGTLSDPTINSGGTLAGSGSVGDTFVNTGGTFAPGSGAPGSFMTVNGSLAFQSGAIYLVQVNPSTASYASVTGTAQLGGATVNTVFANGGYISKTYTILTAAGGVSGKFGSLVNTNLPANFSTSLSYDANNAYLNLVLNFAIPAGLNGNQQAVGNALTNFFNANGGIPLIYGALTPAGLTQASGELGAGAQQTTFNAMSQFMGLLTDPLAQRDGGAGSTSGAAGFVEEDQASAYAARKRTDAFAMVTKAPPQSFEQRWSVWAAGFGGSQTTGGNAIVGSNDATSRVFGTAVGADYRVSAYTLAGFALAGGGTNFSVNGLGSGRSDLFQAGAYLRHNKGPAYLSAALAYGWQDITTDRTVIIAGIDRLRAEFNANAYSGRLEGGWRFVTPWLGGIGLTPYGAAQVTTFELPAYAEQAVSGSGAFALNYAARTTTDTRSELGLRTDKAFATHDGVLTLRGRLAWAHDFNPDRAIAATFQALPGASFVVNGAAQAHDSALTTASADMKWINGWSAAATFEGEFSNVTRSYAGKGSIRYAW